MSFLKFLKKKEKGNFPEEELDVPPAPPSIEHEDLGLESLGEEMPKPPELPELPQIEEEPELKMPEIPKAFPKEIPDVSPHVTEEIPKKPEIPRFKPERFVPEEDTAKKPVARPRAYGESHEITKPIFIKLNSYRNVLDEIEVIKGHLNSFEEVSLRLDGLKDGKDKKFARWNDIFKDMQKKLIFVDKTLFAK